MKYVRTPGFLIDLRRLPNEHRKLFVQAVHEVLRPALDAGAHKGAVPPIACPWSRRRDRRRGALRGRGNGLDDGHRGRLRR